ncbi:hypothetical protein ACRALDRAFT_1078027 [Sodiomyces alcalophilus JCM 7366]|uniref:uncharacterized protein n=1 Tax=Sodiomyces alcalophilus JCM 7366 TaxID=591952 RepID=UPI0039B6DB44
MATTRPHDENLPEVVPDMSPQALSQAELYARHGLEGGEGKYPYTHHDGIEHVPPGDGWDVHKEVVSPLSPDPHTPVGGAASAGFPPPPTPRICGVKRKTFWILLAVAGVVIIAVAVGAGVGATRGGGGGGGDAQEQEQEPSTTPSAASSAEPTATSSSTDMTSSTPSSTSSTSTSTRTSTSSPAEPTPTFLNETVALPVGTFAFQAFSDVNFTGNYTDVYQAEGFFNFPFDVVSYIWLQNRTDCCINFCEGPDDYTGYRCDPREQRVASQPFDHLYIGCNGDAPRGEENRFCSP